MVLFFFISVLLKTIPEFSGAGFSETLATSPVCNPIPSKLVFCLRVFENYYS